MSKDYICIVKICCLELKRVILLDTKMPALGNIFHHDYNFTRPCVTMYLVGISLLKHQTSYLLHPSDVAIFLKMTFKIV